MIFQNTKQSFFITLPVEFISVTLLFGLYLSPIPVEFIPLSPFFLEKTYLMLMRFFKKYSIWLNSFLVVWLKRVSFVA